jgi:glyoxylase I family protein
MQIDHVLAVVAVSDLGTARDWYARLLGREPDNNPMETLIEWQLADHGWLQVSVDPDRAGRSLANLAVADLAAAREEVIGRGIDAAEIAEASNGVALSRLSEPDGNLITLIGGFRIVY